MNIENHFLSMLLGPAVLLCFWPTIEIERADPSSAALGWHVMQPILRQCLVVRPQTASSDNCSVPPERKTGPASYCVHMKQALEQPWILLMEPTCVTSGTLNLKRQHSW